MRNPSLFTAEVNIVPLLLLQIRNKFINDVQEIYTF